VTTEFKLKEANPCRDKDLKKIRPGITFSTVCSFGDSGSHRGTTEYSDLLGYDSLSLGE